MPVNVLSFVVRWFPIFNALEEIMHLRAPNLLLFIVTVILAIVGLLEYLAVPISIPGMPDVTIPRLSSAHAFWIVFLGWVLLAIATVLPQGSRAKPS